MKLTKKGRNNLATIAGWVVAITTSWLLIDWATFEFNKHNIAVLFLSTLNAIAGHATTLIGKDETNIN